MLIEILNKLSDDYKASIKCKVNSSIISRRNHTTDVNVIISTSQSIIFIFYSIKIMKFKKSGSKMY